MSVLFPPPDSTYFQIAAWHERAGRHPDPGERCKCGHLRTAHSTVFVHKDGCDRVRCTAIGCFCGSYETPKADAT